MVRAALQLACAGIVLGTANVSHRVIADEQTFVELARVTARIALLQKTWNRDVIEQDPVSTQVMEARVTGHQTTAVSVRLQASESPRVACLVLHGTGTVNSTTLGVTAQAQVSSLGNHSFDLIKPVYFDGTRFLTRRSHGSIVARSTPFAVTTIASGIPLLGAIGEQIAWSETLRRQPMTDSIVARDVAGKLVPEFDRAVDRELAEANRSWKQIQSRINAGFRGLPLFWRAETGSDSLTLRVGSHRSPDAYLTGRPARRMSLRPEPVPAEDLVLTVHDTLINEALATAPLGGVRISDVAVEKLGLALEQLLSGDGVGSTTILQEALAMEPVLFALQLAENLPLAVRFENGRLALMMRFRVVPRTGPATQMHQLTIHFQATDGGVDRWFFGVGDVNVESEDPAAGDVQITGLIRTQAQQLLTTLPPAEIPRGTGLGAQTGLPDLRLHEVRSRDGVLRVSFRLTDADSP